MSKCKGILDGDKITKIVVKRKPATSPAAKAEALDPTPTTKTPGN